MTHHEHEHRRCCRTLAPDFWRVLAHPTRVVLARNGELALLPAWAERRFKAGEPGATALRIGRPIIRIDVHGLSQPLDSVRAWKR